LPLRRASPQCVSRAGIKNACVHKGLFPPSVEKQIPNLRGYVDVSDVGQAANDWPQLVSSSITRGIGNERRHGRGRLLVTEANHIDHDVEVFSRHGREGFRVVPVAQDRTDVGRQRWLGALASVESPNLDPAGSGA
jgi:hypothetical protein